MQTLSLSDMPSDVNFCIIKLTDAKGALGLIGASKLLNRVLEIVEVKQYFNDIKEFYLSLIHLQHHYRSISRLYNQQPYDIENMKNRVITGKIVRSNCPIPSDHFVLKPALTEKEKKQLNNEIQLLERIKRQRSGGLFIPFLNSHKQKLDKDTEPKDMILKPTLQESYSYKNVTISPISQFTLTFNPGSTLTEETKRKIIQSVDLANKYYAKMSEPENKKELINTFDIDAINCE